MLKKFFLMILLLLSLSNTAFANDEEILKSFKLFIQSKVNPIESTYANNNYDVIFRDVGVISKKLGIPLNGMSSCWYKTSNANFRYYIDLQKTDSLISPYVGYLEMYSDLITYNSSNNTEGEYQTKEEAIQANLIKTQYLSRQYRFVYAYQDNKWVKTRVQFKISGDKFWQDNDLSIDESIMNGNKEIRIINL